jgi:hypothetical protein
METLPDLRQRHSRDLDQQVGHKDISINLEAVEPPILLVLKRATKSASKTAVAFALPAIRARK